MGRATPNMYTSNPLRGGWETFGSSRLSIVRRSWILHQCRLKLDREPVRNLVTVTETKICPESSHLSSLQKPRSIHICGMSIFQHCICCLSAPLSCHFLQDRSGGMSGSFSQPGTSWWLSSSTHENLGNLKLKMIPATNIHKSYNHRCISLLQFTYTHISWYRQEFQCPFGDTEQQACWKQLASRSKLVSFYDSTPPDGRKRPNSSQHISHRRLCLSSCWASCQLKSTNMSIPVSHQQHQTIWMNY